MTSPTTIDLDLQSIRRQFPALALNVDGEPVVYLDNPAGTQVPQRVIDRTAEYWRTTNANQGGTFVTSQRSDALIAQVRQAAAVFLNAASADEIVFGPNMTTLTFALSRAIGRELRPGDEIVVTRRDGHALRGVQLLLGSNIERHQLQRQLLEALKQRPDDSTAAGHDVPLAPALHAFLHAATANLISAGVRLIPLGQTDGQRVLAALEPAIDATAARAIATALDDIGSASFRADIASMRHETQYTRLFRS